MGYMRCCDRCGEKTDSLTNGWHPIFLKKFKYRGEVTRPRPFGEDKFDLCGKCLTDFYVFLDEKKDVKRKD